MRLYWVDKTYFCPMDKGFLEKEGTVTLDVYTCPNCGTKYATVSSQTINGKIDGITDGFTKPAEVYTPHKCEAKRADITLKMTVPCCR